MSWKIALKLIRLPCPFCKVAGSIILLPSEYVTKELVVTRCWTDGCRTVSSWRYRREFDSIELLHYGGLFL